MKEHKEYLKEPAIVTSMEGGKYTVMLCNGMPAEVEENQIERTMELDDLTETLIYKYFMVLAEKVKQEELDKIEIGKQNDSGSVH